MTIFMTRIAFATEVLATLSFFGFFAAITAQIMYRYLGLTIIFSEELARLLNIYAVFLGAAVATRYDLHIRIDVIDRLLAGHRNVSRVARFLYYLATLVFLAILGAGSMIMVRENWDLPLATMSWLSSGHIYLAPAIGSVLMFLLTIGKIAELLGDPKT
jgi:TRAP-type transport system small permease protein